MATKKQAKNGGNPPQIRCKSGRFQLSGWKNKKVVPAKNDFDVERVYEDVSICLSVGVKRKKGWENVQAWFRSSQFGDLKQAVEDFSGQLLKLNGVPEEGGQQ
jgi:hypothetical protein